MSDINELIEKRYPIADILFRYLQWKNVTKNQIQEFVKTNKDLNDEKFLHKLRDEFKLKKNIETVKYWKIKSAKHYKWVQKWVFGQTYLDFGGGDGYMAEFFGKSMGAEKIYCVDVAEWSGQKRKPNPNIIFESDLKKIKDNSVGLISAWHVLHHIKNVEEVIDEFKRILKPNGRLVIYEHDVRGKMQDKMVEFQHRIFTMGMDTMTLKEHKKTHTEFRSQKQWEKMIGLKALKIFKPKTNDYSYYEIFKLES